MNLASFIKARRSQLSLSLEALARNAGLAKGSLHDLETGHTINPQASTIIAVAKALKTKPEIVFAAVKQSLKEREGNGPDREDG